MKTKKFLELFTREKRRKSVNLSPPLYTCLSLPLSREVLTHAHTNNMSKNLSLTTTIIENQWRN